MRPDIFEYSDFRAFLAAWFEGRSSEDPSFSHRALARAMGTKDPSILLSYTKYDKPLGDRRRDRFIGVMELDPDETEYFKLIVDFGQARGARERTDVWDRIAAFRASLQKPGLDAGHFEFMSRWVHVALHTMVSMPSFRDDPFWIAAQLRPRVTPAEVAHARATLLRLGLLVEHKGRLVALDADLHTGPTVRRLASHTLHQQVHALAGEALVARRDVEPEERDTCFLTAALAIPHEDLPALRRKLWEFLMKTSEECSAQRHRADRVVMLEVALFAVSERVR